MSRRAKWTLGLIIAAVMLPVGSCGLLYETGALCTAGLCPSRQVVVTTTTWTWDGQGWGRGVRQEGVGGFDDLGNDGNLAYDPSTRQLVLVGSASTVDETNTWIWSASGWTSTGISAIFTGTLVYDESNRRLLMLDSFPSDTWIAYAWTGDAWLKVNSGSWDHVLAEPLVYDTELNSAVTMDRNCNRGNTTTMFEFQSGTWIAVPNGTLTSWGHLTFDAARSELVLFGDDNCGANGSGNCPAWTWVFNGSKWTRQEVGLTPLVNQSQPGCYNYDTRMSQMVYDPDLQKVLLLGAHQLWAWDGSAWSATSPSLPTDMDSPNSVIAFDSQQHKLFVVSTVVTTRAIFP